MVGLYPSCRSTGLLTLSLAHHGLVTLPPASIDSSNLGIEALVTLHCLLLTWLICQAAEDCSDACAPVKQKSEKAPNLPFRITGLQKTVLDGQPSLLVAIHRKDTSCSSSKSVRGGSENVFDSPFSSEIDLLSDCSKEVEGLLSTVTLQSVLEPYLSMASIADSIPSPVLSDLSAVLAEPLSSLFGYLDDLTPLSTPVSFYWSSVYHLSTLPSEESLKSVHAIDTTVCTFHHASLGDPVLVYAVLCRAFSSGLDVAGVRLLFGEPFRSSSQHAEARRSCGDDSNGGKMLPTLALALRGPDAVYGWTEVVGPDDSALAKVTDPSSVSALFGPGLVHTLQNPYLSRSALAKWFGGRACLKTSTIFGMSDARTKSERRKRQRVRFSESESEDSVSSPLPDVLFPPLVSNFPRLVAQAYSKCMLVISPIVPPLCYSSVLATCSDLGFDIFGAKRIRLNAKRAGALDISSEFVTYFTPSSTPPSPLVSDSAQPPPLDRVSNTAQAPPPLPSMIVIVGRENAFLHSTTLKRLLVRNLCALVEKNDHIEMERCLLNSPDAIAHLIPHSEEKLKILGNFSIPLSLGNGDLRVDGDTSEREVLQEEVCFIAIPGIKSLPLGISILDRIFNVVQVTSANADTTDCQRRRDSFPPVVEAGSTGGDGDGCGGFEMVGMRIIPQLSRFHAKKICPFSVGESLYSQAVQLLSDKPASVFVFRGICCNKRILARITPSHCARHAVLDLKKALQFVVSRDLAEGIHYTSLFFGGKDLFSDSSSRILTPYLPEAWIRESDILQSFLRPREKLCSVVSLPLAHMKLAVKVLNKLSRSGFAFAGIATSEVNLDCADTAEGKVG